MRAAGRRRVILSYFTIPESLPTQTRLVADLLMAPLSAGELTWGLALGGATRGVLVGGAVRLVMPPPPLPGP